MVEIKNKSFRDKGTKRLIGKTNRNVDQRWKQWKSQSNTAKNTAKNMISIKKAIRSTVMGMKQTQYVDLAPVNNQPIPLTSAANMSLAALFEFAQCATIVQGDSASQRNGDTIYFRGIKVQFVIRPNYNTGAGALAYRRYRMMIYAIRVVRGALTVGQNNVDVMPLDYYDNYFRQQPAFQRAKNDLQILRDQYIQFRPTAAAAQSAADTVNADQVWGQSNTYQMDTYLSFPHKLTYTPGGNVISEGWFFYVRFYIDLQSQLSFGDAPYTASLLFTKNQRIYFKDDD